MTAYKQPPVSEAMASAGVRALFEHSESIERQEGGPGLPLGFKSCKGPRQCSNLGGGARPWECSFVSTDNDHQTLVYVVPDSAACVVHRCRHTARASDVSAAVLTKAKARYVAVLVCGRSMDRCIDLICSERGLPSCTVLTTTLRCMLVLTCMQ